MGSSSSKFKKYLHHGDEYAAMQVYQVWKYFLLGVLLTLPDHMGSQSMLTTLKQVLDKGQWPDLGLGYPRLE